MTPDMFRVENHHPKISGTPPHVNWDLVKFSSYFENEHGDQWLCWQDPRGVHLVGGDKGWERITTLQAHELKQDVRLPLTLTAGERLWVSACFTAVRGRLVFVVAESV